MTLKDAKGQEYLVCNFCHKTHKAVKCMLGGVDDLHICSHCIENGLKIIRETEKREKSE